jgi:uncharacterized repeat protein (TIGR04042 family)
MPEMTFSVLWPDGAVEDCYSPSLVVHDHLTAGQAYTVEEFAARSLLALHEASERVRARFGFACSSAAATSQQIRGRASRFGADERVVVVQMVPSLPAGMGGAS